MKIEPFGDSECIASPIKALNIGDTKDAFVALCAVYGETSLFVVVQQREDVVVFEALAALEEI